MIAGRKIEAMHAMYGKNHGCICRDCCNLVAEDYHGRRYYKCIAYGDSRGESTDWALRYRACGLWGIPFERLGKRTMIEMLKHAGRPETETFEGQIKMEGT